MYERACPFHRCACTEEEFRDHRGSRDWRLVCPNGHRVDLRKFVLLNVETGQIHSVTHESPGVDGDMGCQETVEGCGCDLLGSAQAAALRYT
jgi:hypothetical protein